MLELLLAQPDAEQALKTTDARGRRPRDLALGNLKSVADMLIPSSERRKATA